MVRRPLATPWQAVPAHGSAGATQRTQHDRPVLRKRGRGLIRRVAALAQDACAYVVQRGLVEPTVNTFEHLETATTAATPGTRIQLWAALRMR